MKSPGQQSRRGILATPFAGNSRSLRKKVKKEVTFLFDVPLKKDTGRATPIQKASTSRPDTKAFPRWQSTGKSQQNLRVMSRIGRRPIISSEHNSSVEEEEEEVKNLEKWEQKGKESLLNFYVFSLTSKLQSKIMHEDNGPSINLKNINFINIVDRCKNYTKNLGERKLSDFVSYKQPVVDSQILGKEKEFVEKKVYMMKEKMLGKFMNNDYIPMKEKRTIELEFHKELKKHKAALKEIKEARRKLFVENNEKYRQIEKINEQIQRDEFELKKFLVEHKRRLAASGTRSENTSNELVTYMVEKERLSKKKQDRIQEKYYLKAEWERNKENIAAIETRIELIKSKLMFVKGILKEYYTKLLKEGTDTRAKNRGRGFVWLVQEMYKLGFAVDPAMYPDFLEFFQPAVHEYIKDLATKDTELNKLKKRLECLKRESPVPRADLDTLFALGSHMVTRNHKRKAMTPSTSVYSDFENLWQKKKAMTPVEGPKKVIKIVQSEPHTPKKIKEVKESVTEYEKEIMERKSEIENMKKEFAARLGRALAKTSHATRKLLVPRITAALFGESAYEIEITKHAQAAKLQNMLNM